MKRVMQKSWKKNSHGRGAENDVSPSRHVHAGDAETCRSLMELDAVEVAARETNEALWEIRKMIGV